LTENLAHTSNGIIQDRKTNPSVNGPYKEILLYRVIISIWFGYEP
jgi:hypothetical protein